MDDNASQDELVDSKDLWLQIYTSQENKWPTDKFTHQDLTNGIRQKLYKYV